MLNIHFKMYYMMISLCEWVTSEVICIQNPIDSVLTSVFMKRVTSLIK